MAGEEGRTLKVKCATWDQVETFYTQKVKGTSLLAKVPVKTTIGDAITVALVLPNSMVFAIDGRVVKVGAPDATQKYPVVLHLRRVEDTRARLERLVSEGRAGHLSSPELPVPDFATGVDIPSSDEGEPLAADPRAEDVLPEERPVVDKLSALRDRHGELAAHEVLGVAIDADLTAVRRAYFTLAKQHHPDVYGKYRSPGVRALASEVFLYINKAYDLLREEAIASGSTRVPAPAARGAHGWLYGDIEDLSHEVMEAEEEPQPRARATPPRLPPLSAQEEMDEVPFDTGPNMRSPLTLENLFGDVRLESGDTLPVIPAPSGGPTGVGRAATGRPATQPVDPPEPGGKGVSAESAAAARAGREALASERWEEARERLAEALRGDSRNRFLRALYHVASGEELRSRGQAAEAQLHFETALRHDRECVEARRALGQVDKKGIFRRFFDR